MTTEEKFMKKALLEAKKAKDEDEVPIGAVAVLDGKIIARGHNNRERTQNALNHAEMIVIQKACKKLQSWRLDGVTLYVTIEPCPMCMGAILNARIPKLVYGADDKKAGCCGTLYDLNEGKFNHVTEIEKGVLKEECAEIIRTYFEDKRRKKKCL
ncbi:MAG: tRNA adenosine(34) deaminase TadA [Clostridia bacterium]|nr:tRNA adenosine(34) deaminase TadA [Clostridia bacterium]